MLARSLQRQSNIDPVLAVCLVLAEIAGASFYDTLSMTQWQFTYNHVISVGH